MDTVSTDTAGERPAEPEPEDDFEEEPIPPNATPGTLVLRAPERLYAQIAEGKDLLPTIAYFARWTLAFLWTGEALSTAGAQVEGEPI